MLFDSKNIAMIPVIKSIAGDEHIIKRLMKVDLTTLQNLD